MKTISHYTLNTGNMVESSVKDIEKEINKSKDKLKWLTRIQSQVDAILDI